VDLYLNRWAISKALTKPATNRIPRSLPGAKKLDCYVVYAGGPEDKWPLLVDKLDKRGVTGRWWDGESHSYEASLPNELLFSGQIYISRYIETYEFRHESMAGFLIQELLAWPILVKVTNRVRQNLFNKRKLVRQERIAVLKIILAATLSNRNFLIDPVSLASSIHSYRIFYHPQKDDLINYYNLLLKSFVETGDLLPHEGISYKLASKALATLADFETDDRKHHDQVKQQKLIVILTLALVVVGIIQAIATWKHP
jgi:hypothetical protein